MQSYVHAYVYGCMLQLGKFTSSFVLGQFCAFCVLATEASELQKYGKRANKSLHISAFCALFILHRMTVIKN